MTHQVARRFQTLILALLFAASSALAGNEVTVEAEITYHAGLDESILTARKKAQDRARIEALRKAFGTAVTQTTVGMESDTNGQGSSYFNEFSESEVKGDWIRDIEAPVPKVVDYGEDGHPILQCYIKGIAEPWSNQTVDFAAYTLRNGTSSQFRDTHFKPGDFLFLEFRTPVDGYIAAYLVNDRQTAFCLLPYLDSADGTFQVKHGKDIVLFGNANNTDESRYQLSIDNNLDIEHNQIYVIFSTKPFVKANDAKVEDNRPTQCDYDTFTRWLSKCRKRDPNLSFKILNIEVTL